MKFTLAMAVALATAVSANANIIQAKPEGQTNTNTYALNQPGVGSGRSGMEIYSTNDKEHVFTLSPSTAPDPSTAGVGADFHGQLSPGQQSSMGVQFGIPSFGDSEPDHRGSQASRADQAGTMGDFPHGRFR